MIIHFLTCFYYTVHKISSIKKWHHKTSSVRVIKAMKKRFTLSFYYHTVISIFYRTVLKKFEMNLDWVHFLFYIYRLNISGNCLSANKVGSFYGQCNLQIIMLYNLMTMVKYFSPFSLFDPNRRKNRGKHKSTGDALRLINSRHNLLILIHGKTRNSLSINLNYMIDEFCCDWKLFLFILW